MPEKRDSREVSSNLKKVEKTMGLQWQILISQLHEIHQNPQICFHQYQLLQIIEQNLKSKKKYVFLLSSEIN